MDPISWSAALLICIKNLPEIIGLIKSLAAFIQKQGDIAAFNASLNAFIKANEAANASTHTNPPSGNTSALEDYFATGGKK